MKFREEIMGFDLENVGAGAIVDGKEYWRRLVAEYRHTAVWDEVLVHVEPFADGFEALLQENKKASLKTYYLNYLKNHKEILDDNIYWLTGALVRVWYLGVELQYIYNKVIATGNFQR